MIYIDTEGTEVEAIQLSGPTVLNTINGERCAEIGDWMINVPNGIVVLDNAAFTSSFVPKG